MAPLLLSHPQRLEEESIQIFREAVAESQRPVMLYWVGKDSSVMLHLAIKAFYPSKPPFPLLHVDTTWKFQAMYEFRDHLVRDIDLDLVVYRNPECIVRGINPFDHGSATRADIWKTEGLKRALDLHDFDLAFSGARRDEEKSRAKEQGAAGLTLPGHGISTATAMVWEIVLTVGLVSTILGTASGAQQLGPIAALGVGS